MAVVISCLSFPPLPVGDAPLAQLLFNRVPPFRAAAAWSHTHRVFLEARLLRRGLLLGRGPA